MLVLQRLHCEQPEIHIHHNHKYTKNNSGTIINISMHHFVSCGFIQNILSFSAFLITASMAAVTTSRQLPNLENQHSTSCVKIKHVRLFQYLSLWRTTKPLALRTCLIQGTESMSFNHLIKMWIHFTSYFSDIHCNTSFPLPSHFPIIGKFSD